MKWWRVGEFNSRERWGFDGDGISIKSITQRSPDPSPRSSSFVEASQDILRVDKDAATAGLLLKRRECSPKSITFPEAVERKVLDIRAGGGGWRSGG